MPHVDLLDLPYFQGISLDAVTSLVDMMEPAEFSAGQVILSEGQGSPPPLFIATRGDVIITKHTKKHSDRVLAELHSPTLFGEIELFCQIPPVATATAQTRLSCFKLTRKQYDMLFDAQHPAIMSFTLNVARVACHRLAVADAMLAQFLDDEDLAAMRRSVFADMHRDEWQQITGTFRRIDI
jgi:CRP-like cAMP-binding protein